MPAPIGNKYALGCKTSGRPSKYKPEYCEKVIALGKEGKSPAQIAYHLDITRDDINHWIKAHDEFCTAMKLAKIAEQNWWEETGKNALHADKFQAAVWKKSMEARFREDYTERHDVSTKLDENQAESIMEIARFMAYTLASAVSQIDQKNGEVIDVVPQQLDNYQNNET